MIWDGSGPEGLPGRCKPSCCKTPYGHSTVRDGLVEWRRCKCHDPAFVAGSDSLPSVAEIRPGLGLVDVDEKLTSQIADSGNEPTRRK